MFWGPYLKVSFTILPLAVYGASTFETLSYFIKFLGITKTGLCLAFKTFYGKFKFRLEGYSLDNIFYFI